MSDELTDLGFLIEKELEHRGVLHPKTIAAARAALERAMEHLVSGGSVNFPGVGLLYSKVLESRKVAVNYPRAKGTLVDIDSRRVLKIKADEKFRSDLQAGKVERPKKVDLKAAMRKMMREA